MTNLAEALPAEINRVRAIQDEYKSLRGMPQCNPEFAIAAMEQSIQRAITASAEGDVIAMVAAYKDLKEYSL